MKVGFLFFIPMLWGCGAVCGNGVAEEGEACDDGNDRDDDACSNSCVVQDTLDAQVSWTILATEYAGVFAEFSETCGGVAADEIELSFTGPMVFAERMDCSYLNTPIRALLPGDYTIEAILYDTEDGSVQLTNGETNASFTIAEGQVEAAAVTLDFGFADFLGSYVGTYYFSITWDGLSCAEAGVSEQVLLLERDGLPLQGVTDNGDEIDGSTPGTCRTEEFAQAIASLPWGPAIMTIKGLDDEGTVIYEGAFDTFVGAGLSNPEHGFDVPRL